MAKLEELGLVPRTSKRLRSKRSPLAETSSSFMTNVNDDLLMEILRRLSDAPIVAQNGLVCKRWSSLIFSDEFRIKFNQNHRHHLGRYLDPSYSLPYTFLFRSFLHKIEDITFTSSKAMSGIHRYAKSSGYLDFLPEKWHRSYIQVSSGDLLLSRIYVDGHSMAYCVSNPLTQQWNILPQDMPPLKAAFGKGLWLDPNRYGFNRRLGNYMVVLLDANHDFVVGPDNYMFRAVMFCSETGKWFQRNFTAPRAWVASFEALGVNKAVQSKGLLYFPLTEWSNLKGVMAMDPVGSSECQVLNLPDGFDLGWRAELFHRVGFGVVRGRLRLWQLLKDNRFIVLKVWELSDDNDDDETAWVLVHNVSEKRELRKNINVVAFDPNDGDEVFMLISNCICKYNIRENKYEKVGQLTKWNFLRVHTIVHNSWSVLPM